MKVATADTDGTQWPADLDGVRLLVMTALFSLFGASSFLSMSTVRTHAGAESSRD